MTFTAWQAVFLIAASKPLDASPFRSANSSARGRKCNLYRSLSPGPSDTIRGMRRPILGSLVLVALVATAPSVGIADGQQAPGASRQGAAETPWPPAGVFRVVQGITAPRIIKNARPNYPPEAMRAKVQGRVKLEMVVQADGTVGEVRIVSSLDRNKFGIDGAAVKAVKEMRFAPAMKDGVAVPVLLSTEMAFEAK